LRLSWRSLSGRGLLPVQGFSGRPLQRILGPLGQRAPEARVARRGLIEPAVLGAVAFIAVLSRPRTAPGPTERMVAREERARREALAAREMAKKVAEESSGNIEEVDMAQERLEQALEQLASVKAELRAAEEDLRRYPVPEYLWEECGKGTVMIAVTGGSGVGKSSWINSIRRLRPRDMGAAATGVVETTKEPQMFRFPTVGGAVRRAFNRMGRALSRVAEEEDDPDPIRIGDRLLLRAVQGLEGLQAEVIAETGPDQWAVKLNDGNVIEVKRHQVTGVLVDCVIWDLPGVGTPNFPQATYLREMGIRHFDMVAVMTASRFTEAELMLVDELKYWKVPYFLIRNKVDADVQSEVEREEESFDGGSGSDLTNEELLRIEDNTIEKIKHDFESEYSLENVYCISTKRKLLNQYDFQRLELDMEGAMKRQRSLEDDEPPEEDD